MRPRSVAGIAGLAVTVYLAGCSEDSPVGPGGGGDNYVKANTPLNSARRLCATYSAQDRAFYSGNLTADFRYIFSAQSDPSLVVEYGTSWGIAREDSAALHLFEGFVDDQAVFQPGATTISADFTSAGVANDPTHADSTRHYQRVTIAPLGIEITLDADLQFDIANPFDVYVVRGDAAVLRPGQAADSTLWYVRRIDDLAQPIVASPARVLKPASAATWGRIRASYLR